VRELLVKPTELVAGMVLSRDLLSRDGVLLLSRGHRLSEVLVGKIRTFEQQDDEAQLTIHIYAPLDNDASILEPA